VHINLFTANGYLVVQLLEGNLVVSESSISVRDLLAAVPNNAMPTDDLYIHGAPRHNQQILTREQNEALLLAELKNKTT